jgi:intracellular multiplication protein IcmE
MATRKDNLKALFTNTRTRLILLFTGALLIIGVIIGVSKLLSTPSAEKQATADVSLVPNIQSIPGQLNPTPEYAKLQEIQNISQAQQAEKQGTSAIPTIIRLQKLGEGGTGLQNVSQGIGFQALARESQLGPQQSLWLQELKQANCSKSSVAKVTSEGAGLDDLRKGCSCVQLKENGYQLSDLDQICSCKDLRAAGFNARQLKDQGYTAGRLKRCGFDACELRNAGFTAQQLKDGGFTDGELRGAGYSPEEIRRASGIPDGITADDIRRAGCSPDALRKLREAGVTAAAIVRISGCTAAQLKAAGYTAQDLKNAGFTAAQLKNAGFTPDELRKAGYTARDLLDAGFTPKQLADAGYTPAQIQAAESELPLGITPEMIKNAGCSKTALEQERLAGVSAKLIREYAGCSAKALKAAGFTDADLANAGFTPAQIKDATPVTDAQIKAAGCDPKKLHQLLEEGVSAKRIRELNGCTAEQLKEAGYGPAALEAAGFTPQQLLDAGFTPAQLRAAGINPISALAKGRVSDCSVASLKAAREAGVTAAEIKRTLGCSAKAMKEAGYTAKELRDAGYTAAQLKAAGFTAKQLKDAGFTAKQLKDAGFTAAQLKDAGFTAKQLKDAGFSAQQLKDAGFTAAQLKDAGFTAKQLKDAGFTAKQLKDAGFTAAQLKDAGFSAKQLKDAGFSAKQLKDAGFSAKELKDAGFTNQQLENAGFSPADIGVALPPGQAGDTLQDSELPGVATGSRAQQRADRSSQQLQQLLKQQQKQFDQQQFQQRIDQRKVQMQSEASDSLNKWKQVATQAYIAGDQDKNDKDSGVGQSLGKNTQGKNSGQDSSENSPYPSVKTGEIMFAVIDTSVNSDEPGPILATLVSGPFKGSKLIGSFTTNQNSGKMTIQFQTISIPGDKKTQSISAYAIDPNTARTALSSRTDNHYLYRYGSLFASTFLEGFGNAFQSADTTVTIGGTGGGDNITVQNGINRSALENAVIGLATVGKTWAQYAQQNFNRQPTIEVFSGTAIGVLFTQDASFS